ncbi:TetR family transcriptional regulator [Lentzea guizhouensis]|uniref:TetR family transcriptional regulator n=1 Tax=Lentzea guizhouensis TaxID=1586287 RepID=A0A1B2HMI5_9PSEU|nr:TetR/AcrR family transcriptional regulator [Lentzea guizhouensis]ANZ38928.1 TetR family transcriptional regulator [Lentzea guizhouensis]
MASRPLRADAARNRDKLLAAAADVFGEKGLDAALEHIARRAEVSIGTLYAHFPSRQILIDAIFPSRLAVLDDIGEAALAAADPWQGFVDFVEGTVGLQAQDLGLNDAIARRLVPASEAVRVCQRGMGHAERIIARAKESGRLRADFEPADLATLTWAMSQVIRESIDTEPDRWRRFLGFYLDGLRSGS